MAVQQDTLKTTFAVEGVDRLTKALDSVEKKLSRIEHTSGRVSKAMSFLGAGGKLAAVGAAGFGLAKNILEAANAWDQYNARLLTTLGTQERVSRTLDELGEFAKRTPYELGEVVDAFTRLTAYGLNPTYDKMRIIGDFAASMGRSFKDAVEAVADSSRGEFERMKEFGLSKEAVGRFGANLIDAQGKVKDAAQFIEAVFKAMEARSSGAMARLANTLPGKLSNLKDAFFRMSVAISRGAMPGIANALTVITRLFEKIADPARQKAISDFFARTFSVENMKAFAKAMYGTMMVVRDLFAGDFVDALTLVGSRVELFFTRIENNFHRLVGRIGAAMRHLGDINLSPAALLKDPGNIARAFSRASAALTQGTYTEAMVYGGQEALIAGKGDAAFKRMQERASKRKGSMGFIDELFAGLKNDYSFSNGAAANFGAGGEGGKSGLDRLTEMILGGGELARLGVKATEFGPGFSLGPKDNTIRVKVDSGNGDFNRLLEGLFRQFLAGAIRSGQVAVPGGS